MNDLIEFSTCTGFFGEVFKGRMSDTSDQNTMEVAVKTLKGRWLRWMPAHYSMHESSYHYSVHSGCTVSYSCSQAVTKRVRTKLIPRYPLHMCSCLYAYIKYRLAVIIM